MTPPGGGVDAPGGVDARVAGRALARAERAALLRELTALLVHQINQPLASIAASGQAALQWLERPSPDVGEAVRSLHRVIEHKDRAADTIGQIRSAVSALAPASPQVAELGLVIDAARAALAEDLRAAGVRMEIGGTLGPVRLRLPAIELELVFIQLFRNAIEAMAGVEERVLTVRCQTDEAGLTAEVVDTGSGIDASDAIQVFDLFFTTKSGAEGLGLATSRSIVARGGGRLTLWSSSPSGSTFRFELPFAPDDDAAAA